MTNIKNTSKLLEIELARFKKTNKSRRLSEVIRSNGTHKEANIIRINRILKSYSLSKDMYNKKRISRMSNIQATYSGNPTRNFISGRMLSCEPSVTILIRTC